MPLRSHRSGVVGLFLVVVAFGVPTPGAGAAEGDEANTNPYFTDGATPGSGIGKRIGYISLSEDVPFVQRVSASIVEQATVAGVELLVCDSQFSLSEAIVCARQLAEAGAQGVLNFQTLEDAAGQVCEAYGGLPTVAIDIHQRPCEVAFVGVDNRRAGLIVGEAVGDVFARDHACDYDSIVLLEAGGPGETAHERIRGMVDAFVEVCGSVPGGRLHRFDAGGTTIADEAMSDFLRATPAGGDHIIFAVNDDAALGALRAATALGREGELWFGSQGGDPASLQHIACDPRWIADAAYFPERYGRTLIPAMIDILDGKVVPPEMYTPHVALTSENIRESYPEVPACG